MGGIFMKVAVNKELCIGCGACAAITDNEFFEIGDDGFAQVKEEYKDQEVPSEKEEVVQDAMDSCPTSAIEEKKEA